MRRLRNDSPGRTPRREAEDRGPGGEEPHRAGPPGAREEAELRKAGSAARRPSLWRPPLHASCRSAAAMLAARLHSRPSGAHSGARRSLSSATSPHSRTPNAWGRPQARRKTRTQSERSAALTHGARRLHAAAAAARRKGKAARAAASRHPPAAAPPAAVPPSHWPAARRGWARRLSITARDGRPWFPGGGVRVAVGGGRAAWRCASRRPADGRPSAARRCP